MKTILFRLGFFLFIASLCLPQKLSARPAIATVCDENSLRAALANGGIIKFGCDGTIVLSSTLQITTNTVLDGSGHNVVLSGGDAVRVLFVAANVDLAMTNVTIANGKQQGTNITSSQNGEPAFGAGIFNDGGHIALIRCVLSNNTAWGGDSLDLNPFEVSNGGNSQGAAICNIGGSLWMSNCVVSANLSRAGAGRSEAQGSVGGIAMGGAIYSSSAGAVNIYDSRFEENTALGATGTGEIPYSLPGSGAGGALFVEGGNLLLKGTRFSNNQSVGGEIPVFQSKTSGSAQGGAAFLTNCSANISLCKFLTNSAVSGSVGRYGTVGVAQGGALLNAADLTLVDALFAGNSVVAGEGATGYSEIGGGEADGGAIFNMEILTATRCTIAGNEAHGGIGHEIMSFEYLGGDGKGGGIYNQGVFSATNITVSSNQAFGGLGSGPGRRPGIPDFDPLAGAGGNAEGGGIFTQGNMTMVHSTVALNAAWPGAASRFGQAFTNDLGVGLGGGIFMTNMSPVLQNTIVANSPFGSNCFGVLIDNGNNLSSDASCQFTAPGSFNNTDPLLNPLGDFGGPTPTMALLPGSPAIEHGLAIYCPATDQRGIARPFGVGCDIGAFEWVTATTVTVCESSLRAAITNGGTINFGCDGTIVLSSTLQVTTNTVLDGTGHKVVISGGEAVRVLFVNTNIDLTINNLTIANGRQQGTNIAGTAIGESAFGAGVFNDGGRIILIGCVLSNNIASGGKGSYFGPTYPDQLGSGGNASGGAIFNNGGSISVTNCLLSANVCRGGVGKLWATNSTGGLAMGGGIYSQAGTLSISDTQFENNSALGDSDSTGDIPFALPGSGLGGALFVEGGDVLLTQTRFSSNQAVGGNVEASAGFRLRISSGHGGAAYLTNCSAKISLCKFLTSHCAAGRVNRYGHVGISQGGALFNAARLKVLDTLFAENDSVGGLDEFEGGESDGGAICNVSSLAISGCTITRNEALGGNGGGRWASYAYWGGKGKGGGIYNEGDFSATNMTLVSNRARGGLARIFHHRCGINFLAGGTIRRDVFDAGSVF